MSQKEPSTLTPSPLNPPSGCAFCTRCRFADGICSKETPDLTDTGGGHLVACHHMLDG